MSRVKEDVMKITGFRPLIVTKEAKALVELFEELGFERKHTKTDIEGGKNTNYVMKDANGNCVNVASSERVPQDLTSISINVDDFDEAYEFFTSRGFKNTRGDKVTKTSSSEDTYLISPSGFAITLTQHIITSEGDE
jgi:N-acetylglutamate synthase-like GNAT family acetyltransferase